MTIFVSDDEKWNALIQREHQADGCFWYGVLTTGVYCRPSCASRRPNRDNVRFFSSCEEAERQGFRPCRRCRPAHGAAHDPHLQAIRKACDLIAEADPQPDLGQLAHSAGLSPFHFQRLFKKIVGITPKQYAMQHRLQSARANLRKSATITEALYESGYAASSRFYEQSATALGMRPQEYKNGAPNVQIRHAVVQNDLGWVLVAATEKGICAILLGDSPERLEEELRRNFPKALFMPADPDYKMLASKVLELLEAPRHPAADLPLDIQGTAFQRRVWQALQAIPPGTTVSYGEIARRIGQPSATRAVAQACAQNALAVAVPCHRVVRHDGRLGGYRWGVDRKRRLLQREVRAADSDSG